MPDRPKDDVPAGYIAPGAMTEFLTDDWGFFIRTARQYERFTSPYQTVEVHETVPFGKLFRLDGCFMTSEKDEFFYHENLVHVAAVTHPQPERALVVGGGDGGSAEEILKHPSIKSVTLAEIDLAVVAPYLTSVPLYGGLWMMACCAPQLDPRTMSPLVVERRIAQRGLAHLQYYNGDTHRAAFALPNFVRALVG